MQDYFKCLKSGNAGAFKHLFDTYFNAGVLLLRNYLPDGDLIPDIVQDVFINIWNRRESFESETHLRGYYYKSLRNRAFNHLARTRESEPVVGEFEDTSDGIIETILREEVHRIMISALDKLPEQRRKVVTLFMDGKTHEEISEIMGISANTIKTHKRLAYSELRKELEKLMIVLWFIM